MFSQSPMSEGSHSLQSKSLTGNEDKGSNEDGFLICPNCLNVLVGVILPNRKPTQDIGSSHNSISDPDSGGCENTKAKSTDVNITTLATFYQGCSISLTDEDMVALNYLKSSFIKYAHPEIMLPSYRIAKCDENKLLIEQHVQKLLNPLK